jgi:hypothetical protein
MRIQTLFLAVVFSVACDPSEPVETAEFESMVTLESADSLKRQQSPYDCADIGEPCVGGTSGREGTIQRCHTLPEECCCQTVTDDTSSGRKGKSDSFVTD